MSEIKIVERTYKFALLIIKISRLITRDTAGIIIGKQLIRSGTSIGANVEEAQGAGSKKDFFNKINIAKKEARGTKYWLRLITDSQSIKTNDIYAAAIEECNSIVNILTAISKKVKD